MGPFSDDICAEPTLRAIILCQMTNAQTGGVVGCTSYDELLPVHPIGRCSSKRKPCLGHNNIARLWGYEEAGVSYPRPSLSRDNTLCSRILQNTPRAVASEAQSQDDVNFVDPRQLLYPKDEWKLTRVDHEDPCEHRL